VIAIMLAARVVFLALVVYVGALLVRVFLVVLLLIVRVAR
jgi:hypothetical protein